MKSPISLCRLAVLLLAGLALNTEAAVLSVSPSSLDWSSGSNLTLNITGVASHQSVLIEEFWDANNNGAIDTNELLILSFQVQDGEVPLFGGVRDPNQPGDEDGLTNGQIRAVLTLAQLAERNRGIGSYLFRVSALDSSFTPVAQPFAITQGSYAQTITGRVLDGASPVPSALVGLLVQSGDDMSFFAGTVADNGGQFTINAPAGAYMMVGLKPGYLADFNNSPLVSLDSGMTLTQNVAVLPGSFAISGRVVDAITSNGIPGLQLFAESKDGKATLGFTDKDGNYFLSVSPGIWKIDPSDSGVALLGYGKTKATADTSGGGVSGLNIALSKSRGQMQLVFFFPPGTFGNGTNGQFLFPTDLQYYYALYNLNDVNVPTNVFFTGPNGSGLSNTVSAVFGADNFGNSVWYSSAQIPVPAYPPGGTYLVNYKNQPQPFVLPNPDAANRQVILQPTASVDNSNLLQSLTWSSRDRNGNLISIPPYLANINIRIDGIGGRLYDVNLSPNETSHDLGHPVVWTNVSSIQMVYDDNLGSEYVTFWNRGNQPLQVVSSNLPPGYVGIAYHSLMAGAGGSTPYSWSLQSGTLPPGLGFTPVTGEIDGTPTLTGNYAFTVRLRDQSGAILDCSMNLSVGGQNQPVQIQAIPLTGSNRFGVRVQGQTGRSYTLQYTTTLTNWTTLLTSNGTGASMDLIDSSATNRFRFYRLLVAP